MNGGSGYTLPRRVAQPPGARSIPDQPHPRLAPRGDSVPYVAIHNQLSDLRIQIPGVRGCVLGGVDGLLIAHDLPAGDAEPHDLAALAATTFGLGRQVGLALRHGPFRESTVRGQHGYFAVYAVNDTALLAVLGEDAVNVARLHLHAPAVTERLAALLGGGVGR
ncbi:roadblock/LC7 domain-containing protein [Polymorphospora lycopeni]|uniref:Roadblock/LC7 domain-containing protein n=1 Tax=Polymorphospora lycopeni TaxID=3140240 RepID=A0ABV5CKN0_9ACTN